MWLLSSNGAQLHWFSSPKEVPDGYAIFSYVEDQDDETFEDIQKLQERASGTESIPRRGLSDMIMKGCELAAKDGYKYVWIYPCCVNAESTEALEETFTSLYDIYADASVCYAFLSEVDSKANGLGTRSKFVDSEWHSSGWTLPAVLASKNLVFISNVWDILGNRNDFIAELLHAVEVPEDVLTQEADIRDRNLFARMFAAKGRKTYFRPEDNVHCLSWLFGVRTEYVRGEDEKIAFYKFQDAVRKSSPDLTLFLWGRTRRIDVMKSAPQARPTVDGPQGCPHHFAEESYLLAPLLSCFSFDCTAWAEFRPWGYSRSSPQFILATNEHDGRLPTFTMAGSGELVLADVPIFEPAPDSSYAVALMSVWSPGVGHMGLIISECKSAARPSLGHPLYHCGGRNVPCRSAGVPEDFIYKCGAKVEWRKIYLMLMPFEAVADKGE